MSLCLVDGAGGFIGSHVAHWLLEEGYEVRVTDLPRADLSRLESRGAETVKADLLSMQQTRHLLKGVDRVFHVAGLFNFALPYGTLYDANVVATRNMCEAALAAGVETFVHWSTVGIYGLTEYTPIDEAHPKNPTNAYEETKWLGEQMAMRYHRKGLPVIVIRPSLVYGPRSRYGYVLILAGAAAGYWKRKKAPIRIVGDILVNQVHADDVARAAIHLAERTKETVGKAFNIADETPMSLTQMFGLAAELLGIKIGFPIPLYKRMIPYLLAATSPIAPLLDRMITVGLEIPNRRLSQHWDELMAEFGIKEALRPRIDKDWIFYGAVPISKWRWVPAGDKVYDNTALKSTGFEFMWPDFREGIKQTLDWYIENGWLPKR